MTNLTIEPEQNKESEDIPRYPRNSKDCNNASSKVVLKTREEKCRESIRRSRLKEGGQEPDI